MNKVFLISLVLGLYVLINLIAFCYISSYRHMYSVFKSSNHYQILKRYQDKWDVPIWLGEFGWTARGRGYAKLTNVWMGATGFKYKIEESMIKVFDTEGWGWNHWEPQRTVFEDEKENAMLTKYTKDSWKPSNPIPKLVVNGKKIQTEDGKPILLKGRSLPLKHLAYYSNLEATEETFQKLDNMGMNSVRLVVDMDSLIPQENTWNQKSFETLKTALDLAQKYNIYVIIDLHQYRGSSFFTNGHGFPPWYVQRYKFDKSERQKFRKMWISKQPPFEDSWDFLVEGWKKIIEVSKNRNIVAGYDLFNEPGEAYKLYEYLSQQIEPLDPNKIHFAETIYLFKGMDNDNKPKINNLVLAPHTYDIWLRKNVLATLFVTSTLLLLPVLAFSIATIARKR